VLTVSSLVPASMGLGELCVSLPTVLDRQGINYVVPPALALDEDRALKRSAEILKKHIATVPGLGNAAAA